MWGSSRLNADLWKGNIGFARSQVLSHMGWIPSSMYKKGEKPSLRGHPVYLYETTWNILSRSNVINFIRDKNY